MLFNIMMVSARMPLKSTAKEALRRSLGLRPYSDSWHSVQVLLQFCRIIVKFLKRYSEMANPSVRIVFLRFKTLCKVMARRELVRSDVDCCYSLLVLLGRPEPPGLGAGRVGFKHKMVLLQFKGNVETKGESSFSWSIRFSLLFSQHPRFRFPLAALQGEAVESVVKGRKGQSACSIIEGFGRWLSLTSTSLPWLSQVVGVCLTPVRPQPRDWAGGSCSGAGTSSALCI